jgi:methionyl aminopeptidase
MIIIKTPQEIEALRIAGARHRMILDALRKEVREGISTEALDRIAEALIREQGDIPAFKGYQPDGAHYPFPASLCTSLNDEIVHGIPSPDRILKAGDCISLDLGLRHDRVFTDAAITVCVGAVSQEVEALIRVTEEALEAGIAAAQPGNRIGDISHAIQQVARGRYGIVRGFAGHGVGRFIHEDPYIPNYGHPHTGPLIQPGMVFAIEPMFTLGHHDIRFHADGYTVSTRDRSYAAHSEHTVLITSSGPEILT